MTGNALQAFSPHHTRSAYTRLRSHDDRFPGYAPRLVGIVELQEVHGAVLPPDQPPGYPDPWHYGHWPSPLQLKHVLPSGIFPLPPQTLHLPEAGAAIVVIHRGLMEKLIGGGQRTKPRRWTQAAA